MVCDVLSFTTTVSVALDRGIAVLPYRWRDDTAADFARQHDAALAVGRSEVDADHPWSLSPAALRRAPIVERLVLPSPNGATIATTVDAPIVVAACLRNASAVAQWLHDRGSVLIVPAGERWPDDSLRPALEDLLGAGAVAAALAADGRTLSPEATAAAQVYAATVDVAAAVRGCVSGVELIDHGFPEDVAIATEINASAAVPLLVDGAFRQA